MKQIKLFRFFFVLYPCIDIILLPIHFSQVFSCKTLLLRYIKFSSHTSCPAIKNKILNDMTGA